MLNNQMLFPIKWILIPLNPQLYLYFPVESPIKSMIFQDFPMKADLPGPPGWAPRNASREPGHGLEIL